MDYVVFRKLPEGHLIHSYHRDAFDALKTSLILNNNHDEPFEVLSESALKYLINQRHKAVLGLRPECF